jgi:hypothetical protein
LLIATAVPLGSAEAECMINILSEGTIRVCRNWNLMGEQCRKYNHVKLPYAISVGDVFRVTYGSNPKGYEFHVGRIKTNDGACSLYPFAGGHNVRDRITATCQSCSDPRPN